MTIGPPCRLTCPHCGAYKHIYSIMSGNTFNGTVWSDTKKYFPMLLSTSLIQRCPECEAYYFYEDGKPVEMDEKEFRKTLTAKKLSEEDIKRLYRGSLHSWYKETAINRLGHLNEIESREAYESLYSESLSKERKTHLLITRLYAFNDEYLRNGNTLLPELQTVQEDFIYKIINLYPDETIFIAELYREIGQFEKAIELLRKTLTPELDEQSEIVVKKILEHAEDKDRSVFILAQW